MTHCGNLSLLQYTLSLLRVSPVTHSAFYPHGDQHNALYTVSVQQMFIEMK